MDYTELNKSLEQSHNNLLYTSIDLQRRLSISEKKLEVFTKYLFLSWGLNIFFIVYFIVKGVL